MTDLLPCPFCGGGAVAHAHPGTKLRPHVTCSGCDADCTGKTLDGAIRKWNRRAAPASEMARAAQEALAFLESIEGSGYGGMSDYDCAVDSLRSAIGASPTGASDEGPGTQNTPSPANPS